jgi:hypothetical protein
MDCKVAGKPVRNNSQQNHPHCDKKKKNRALRTGGALLPSPAPSEKSQQYASFLGAACLFFPSHFRDMPLVQIPNRRLCPDYNDSLLPRLIFAPTYL